MYDIYVIKDDDTIDKIISKLGISFNILRNLNGDKDIRGGNMLVIPKYRNEIFDYYTINKGDTLYKIANQYKVDPTLLAQLNGINPEDYIYPNQTLIVPKEGSLLYFTAEGDTLSEVAKGMGISIDELVRQNNNIYLQKEQLLVYKYN